MVSQVPLEREEVLSIAKDVREEAERLGRERDPEGKVLFEVKMLSIGKYCSPVGHQVRLLIINCDIGVHLECLLLPSCILTYKK